MTIYMLLSRHRVANVELHFVCVCVCVCVCVRVSFSELLSFLTKKNK